MIEEDRPLYGCPFCDNRNARVKHKLLGYYVECSDCHIKTEIFRFKDAAISTWNRRNGIGVDPLEQESPVEKPKHYCDICEGTEAPIEVVEDKEAINECDRFTNICVFCKNSGTGGIHTFPRNTDNILITISQQNHIMLKLLREEMNR